MPNITETLFVGWPRPVEVYRAIDTSLEYLNKYWITISETITNIVLIITIFYMASGARAYWCGLNATFIRKNKMM